MYNAKSYTNYINTNLVKCFKNSLPMCVYALPDDAYFVAFSYTTHFIHSDDLTLETQAIIAQKAEEYKPTAHFAQFVEPHGNTTDIKICRSYIPNKKCGIKRLLEYKGRYSHFLNEALLKKFGKLEKLLLACPDTGRFDTILVYRDNGEGWISPEYLGTICPVVPKLENFTKELEF